MKRTSLQSLVSYFAMQNGLPSDVADAVDELKVELNKGAVAKAAKDAGYDAAWPIVCGVFSLTDAPLTVAEIFEQVEVALPEGFTKGKVQYGLTHQWADRVVKIEGKPNTYRLA